MIGGTVAALELAKSRATQPIQTPRLPCRQLTLQPQLKRPSSCLPLRQNSLSSRQKYPCTIMNIKPRNNSTFSRGDAFDIKWKITNTGSATWVDGVDVKIISGPATTGAKRVK